MRWLLTLGLVFFATAFSPTLASAQDVPPGPGDVPPVAPSSFGMNVSMFDEWLPERKFWTGGIELGVTGADGNSNNFTLRTALGAKYENDRNLYKTDFLYAYANADSQDTQNRWLWTNRYERLHVGTPWSCYVRGEAEHDEFKNFDIRLSAHLGSGYMLLKNDKGFAKARLGAGGSQKIGGPDTAFRPELDLGLDFERTLNDRSKIAGTIDYFPSLLSLEIYRVEARIAYEVLIDPTYNLTLKIGLLDTYDSQPAGRRPNDISYYATILWKF